MFIPGDEKEANVIQRRIYLKVVFWFNITLCLSIGLVHMSADMMVNVRSIKFKLLYKTYIWVNI